MMSNALFDVVAAKNLPAAMQLLPTLSKAAVNEVFTRGEEEVSALTWACAEYKPSGGAFSPAAGCSPSEAAASLGIITMLLGRGADPNYQNTPSGRTCLHSAALRDDSELAMLILSSSPPEKLEHLLTVKDKDGFTPMDIAPAGSELLELLQECSKEFSSAPREKHSEDDDAAGGDKVTTAHQDPNKSKHTTTSSPGRLVLLCGPAGGGKTCVAEALKEKHGFLHFDGDSWQCGLDPIERSGMKFSSDIWSATPEPRKTLRDDWVEKYYMKLCDGAPTEEIDLSAMEAFYREMFADVLNLRGSPGSSLADRDIVVSHAILQKQVRDLAREVLGGDVEILALDVSIDALRARKQLRLERQAALAGQTLEELLMKDEMPSLPTSTFEDRLRAVADPKENALVEPPRPEDEEVMHLVSVKVTDNQASVLQAVECCLKLKLEDS